MPSRPTPSPLLSVQGLSVDFRLEDGRAFRALHEMNLTLHAGEIVALVGESGSGKSVAALSIMGLLQKKVARVVAGKILLQGQDLLTLREPERLSKRGRDMAMIFQDPMTALNPVQTVGQQIAETLTLHQGLTGAAAQTRIAELLNEVGLTDLRLTASTYPHQLSGGQQQRVMIAMALAGQPSLIIADEPTTALDVTLQKQVLTLMVSLQKKHRMAILFITHDLALVKNMAHRVVVMRRGQVRETGSVADVFSEPKDPYTRALLACRPPQSGRPARLPVITDFLHEPDDDAATVPRAQPLVPLTASLPRVEAAQPLLVAEHINTWLGNDSWFSGKRRVHIVRDVSFRVNRGETLGIVGESGSGKTTLGLSLLRLYPATGSFMLGGENLFALTQNAMRPYRRRLQIIFQNPLASLNPRFTVGEVLTEPLRVHGMGENRAQLEQMARRWLDHVGIAQSAWNRYPHEFSGGQCQRLAIARSLTLNPDVLICDESVSALDVSIQAQILNLLRDLQNALQLTYLFISHDLNVVRYLSSRIMVMKAGAVVEENTADNLFQNPQTPYTQQLLAAMPRL